MIRPTLHSDANATTLAFARIFVMGIWLVHLFFLDLTTLASVPSEMFHPFGVLQFIPSDWLTFFTNADSLGILKWMAMACLTASLFGIGRRKSILITAVLLTFVLGLTKGFGGHVNHRELVLLYVTFMLAVLPSCDACCLFSAKTSVSHDDSVYVSSMQLIALLILVPYFMIALARVCVGSPDVFLPQTMFDWVVSRNVRPNGPGGTLGLDMLAHPVGRLMLAASLPISTVIELAAPACLWCHRWIRTLLLVALACFHIGIYFIMNICFFENVVLLLLATNYTPMLKACVLPRHQAVVHFAGEAT